jgi:hypothetical protein
MLSHHLTQLAKSKLEVQEMNQTMVEVQKMINMRVRHLPLTLPLIMLELDPHPVLVLVELGLLKSNFNNCPK